VNKTTPSGFWGERTIQLHWESPGIPELLFPESTLLTAGCSLPREIGSLAYSMLESSPRIRKFSRVTRKPFQEAWQRHPSTTETGIKLLLRRK
jgi:hypothetical protein